MVAKFDLTIFTGKNDRSWLAKRGFNGGDNWAAGEFFPVSCLGGKTLFQFCLLHLFPQGLAVNPENFRRSCFVAADV